MGGGWTVTKPGEQPPACCIDTCTNPPAKGDVYCLPHAAWYAQQNGTATTPPLFQADDPELLEREAQKAKQAEAEEYAAKRRVKTWKYAEDGKTRIPDELYTDEELEAMDKLAALNAEGLMQRLNANETMRLVEQTAPQSAKGVSLQERLAELESELHTEQVCAGETRDLARFWEDTANRRKELLEVALLQLNRVIDARTREQAMAAAHALRSLIDEELHGVW